MNGIPQIAIVNPIVEMVERLLADVKANNISSVGLVVVTPQGGIGAMLGGPQRTEIYLGAGILQKRMLQEIDPPPGAQQRPAIIRATAAPGV